MSDSKLKLDFGRKNGVGGDKEIGGEKRPMLQLKFKRKYRKKEKPELRMEPRGEILGMGDVCLGYKWKCEQCHCQYEKRPKVCRWMEWEYDWVAIFGELGGDVMPWTEIGDDLGWMYRREWCGSKKFLRGVGWGKCDTK